MGKVEYFKNNNRILFDSDVDEYANTKLTSDKMIMIYDEIALGPIGGRDAFKIKFVVEDGVAEPIEEGPYAGQDTYTAGRLTKVNLYNRAGDLLMQISDLDVSMVHVSSMILYGDGWSAVYHILGQGHVFYGADQTFAGDPETGDRIYTGAGADEVFAGKGDDWIWDAGGADSYSGGIGWDYVTYNRHRWALPGANEGIEARLDHGYVIGADGIRDTVKSIEGIQGTMFDDRMIGNSKANDFQGLAGNDYFDGRGGVDWVSYFTEDWIGGVRGVRVNLAQGTAKDQWGTVDTLKNIERVAGSARDDVLRDDKGDNLLKGYDGDDKLSFGRGDDGAEGGGGEDKFIFRGDNFGNDHVRDFEDGLDLLKIENAPRFAALDIVADGGDTLVQWHGNEIRLNQVDAGDINADDFIF